MTRRTCLFRPAAIAFADEREENNTALGKLARPRLAGRAIARPRDLLQFTVPGQGL